MATLFSKANKRKFLAWFLPPLIYVFIKILYLTCKKKFHSNQNGSETPSIYAVWHGEILMISFGYMYYSKKKQIDTVVSQHFDGELVARLFMLFGGGTLRGSSSKGGKEVLRLALSSLKNGRDIGITPDGPRGPRHSVAHGLITMASLQKVPIITMNCKASSYWKMRSWDQFCIPKPFSTIEFYFGDPFYVNDMPLEEARILVQKKLLENAQ